MLNKRIVFIGLAVCLTLPTLAQRTEIFAITGISGSMMRENGSNDHFSRYFSGHGGVIFGIGSEDVLIETGILYSIRGAGYKDPITIGGVQFDKLKMNFFDVPLMIVIAPSKFRFFAGPQVSFLSGASYGNTKFTSTELKNSFEKTTFGIRYGMGFIVHSNIVLQFHLINGLSDINKGPNVKWKNNAMQLAVGYRFFSSFIPRTEKSKQNDDLIPEHRKID